MKWLEKSENKQVEISVPEKNKTIELSDNSRTILEKRYLRKKEDGTPVETIEQMFERIAKAMAEADEGYRDVELSTTEFYNMLTTKKFFPNSPTFTGAGTPLGQLAACFVLPIDDEMGRSENGIFSTLRNAVLIQQTGGGNGFSFSDVRPKGSFVSKSAGKATGPVGFLKVYDAAFGEIAQGGVRRGANMAVLRVDHPDIRDFIKCKSQEGSVANFNISVAITDVFMHAVQNDTTYELINPKTKEVAETPQAREIFDLIVEHAYRKTIELSTRFLDNVVTQNSYVAEVPRLREAALDARRIGLGFMGLADLMYSMGIRYGSEEGQEFAAHVTEFMRFHSMKTSIALAQEKGPFAKFEGSIYDPKNFRWEFPRPLVPYKRDFGMPAVDWTEITTGIKEHGIRNAAQTTVAPTGTISTVAGVEGYGCEPVFALAYYRNVYQAAMDEAGLTSTYTSPMFEKALDNLGISGDERKAIVDEILQAGSCQNIKILPEEIRNTFVVSADITPDEHLRMQASIQAFIDNSISKTCNFPADATREDVAAAYKMGWELGCKGLTVYVTGSRSEVVLETKGTKDKKTGVVVAGRPAILARPTKLTGSTYKLKTPQGNAYVTLNRDEAGNPLEIFLSVGKAGSDVSGLAEALGRALSGWLQASADTHATVAEMSTQLRGIGGSRSVGFGQNRISSIADAVARVLIEEFKLDINAPSIAVSEPTEPTPKTSAHADMCPECGNSSLVKEEGCAKCYNCGYSVC